MSRSFPQPKNFAFPVKTYASFWTLYSDANSSFADRLSYSLEGRAEIKLRLTHGGGTENTRRAPKKYSIQYSWDMPEKEENLESRKKMGKSWLLARNIPVKTSLKVATSHVVMTARNLQLTDQTLPLHKAAAKADRCASISNAAHLFCLNTCKLPC